MTRRTLALILSVVGSCLPASAYAQSTAPAGSTNSPQPNGPQKMVSEGTVPAAQFLDAKPKPKPTPSPRPTDDTVPAAQFLDGKAPPPAPKPAVTEKKLQAKPKPIP